MPLTINNRAVGVHALIVGVSDYTHLPGDDDPAEGGNKFDMKKLKASSIGAYRFLQWLKRADQNQNSCNPWRATMSSLLRRSRKQTQNLVSRSTSTTRQRRASSRRCGNGAHASLPTETTSQSSIFRVTAFNATRMMPF